MLSLSSMLQLLKDSRSAVYRVGYQERKGISTEINKLLSPSSPTRAALGPPAPCATIIPHGPGDDVPASISAAAPHCGAEGWALQIWEHTALRPPGSARLSCSPLLLRDHAAGNNLVTATAPVIAWPGYGFQLESPLHGPHTMVL